MGADQQPLAAIIVSLNKLRFQGDGHMRWSIRQARDRIGVFGSALVLSAIAFAIAFWWIEPAPPSSITIATGAPGGAYDRWGAAYKTALEEIGIKVELRHTAGAIDNLNRLESGEADVAFLQSGLPLDTKAESVRALASLAPEPAWIFTKPNISTLRGLRGRTIAGGEVGSGTLAFSRRLIDIAGLKDGATRVVPIGGAAAIDALKSGKVDAVILISASVTGPIQTLLHDPKVRLLTVDDAAGLARLHPWLTTASLLAGSVDYGDQIPQQTHTLLSTTALLVARAGLHPAVVDVLLGAASRINGEQGLFTAQGEYPQRPKAELAASKDALRYFNQGPTLLRRYLPFWIAAFVERAWVLLLPLLTVMFPLFRIAPPTYRWRIKHRINKHYRRLQNIERQLDNRAVSSAEGVLLTQELSALERDASHVNVPIGFMNDVYQLRRHIGMVRERIETLSRSQEPVTKIAATKLDHSA
jgi:TRAP transporter TAXI family solute receptor